MIYDFINKLSEGISDTDGILPLEELDREETLLTFKAFSDKTDKTIY